MPDDLPMLSPLPAGLDEDSLRQLGQSVSHDYHQWKQSRARLENKWRECWEAYLCDVKSLYTETPDDNACDRSRIARPVLYEAVEAIHANLLNALFPANERFFSVIGKTETDHANAKAKAIEEFLRGKLEEASFIEKYFAFKVDDLDKAQANVNILEGYAGRAAIAIRDIVDSRLIGHYADVDAGNVIGTDVAPITLTSSNIYSYITQLGEKLDTSNVPQEGRNLVITPKFKTLLLQSTEFTRATSLGDNVIQNGYIGNVAGFSVHVTT